MTLDQDDLDAIALLLTAGVSVSELQQPALEDLFTVDAGNSWETASDGSVVNELCFGAVSKRGFFGLAGATGFSGLSFDGDLNGATFLLKAYTTDATPTVLGTWDGATFTPDVGWVAGINAYLMSVTLENFTVPITGGTFRFSVPTEYAGTLGPYEFAIPGMTDTPEMYLLNDGKITTSLNAVPHTFSTDLRTPLLDEAYEGAETVRELLRFIRAVLLGKASGGGTVTISYRDAADTKDRVVLTVTSAGDRTAVVADGS